jgi:hypothetical protein
MRIAGSKRGLPTISFNEKWVKSVSEADFLKAMKASRWPEEDLKNAYRKITGSEPKKAEPKKAEEGGK